MTKSADLNESSLLLKNILQKTHNHYSYLQYILKYKGVTIVIKNSKL
jgi:hypothetical protein